MRRTLAVLLMAFVAAAVLSNCNKDRTPPLVTIIQPAENAPVSGMVTIQARATDDKSVPVVDFYVDNQPRGTDSAGVDSVYAYVWDATALDTNSQHTIKARATDAAGNAAESPTVTVTIGVAAGPTFHQGVIAHPEIWDPRGNPHIVTADLRISDLVTIRPGCVVRAAPGARITVAASGGLLARGTSSRSITFTRDTTSQSLWDGIEVGAGAISDSVIFDYCTIEYGGKDSSRAALDLKSGPIIVRHSTIRNGAGDGVRTNGSNLKEFSGNTVTGNQGYALRIDSRYLGLVTGDNSLADNGRGAEVFGGSVPGSATWRALGASYVITDNITVGDYYAAPVLTLEPGVTLRFRPGLGIVVGTPDSTKLGGLVAIGTPSNPVVFTSDSSQPRAGNWNGITFWKFIVRGSAALDYGRIEYAGGNGFGSVFADSAPVRITYTTIQNSTNCGVYIQKTGFPQFIGNTVRLCESYPVRIDPEYVVTIGNSVLSNPPRSGVLIGDGKVKTSATWNNFGFPYVVGGTVNVGDPNHPVLTLAPGDSILFTPGARFGVGSRLYTYLDSGALVADGSSNRIVFSSTVPQRGAWQGLEIQNYTMSNLTALRNVLVQYGGGNGFGNVLCQGSNPLLRDCEIAYGSAHGIYLYNSQLNRDTLRAYNYIHDNDSSDIGP
jgi:hypothetical protein